MLQRVKVSFTGPYSCSSLPSLSSRPVTTLYTLILDFDHRHHYHHYNQNSLQRMRELSSRTSDSSERCSTSVQSQTRSRYHHQYCYGIKRKKHSFSQQIICSKSVTSSNIAKTSCHLFSPSVLTFMYPAATTAATALTSTSSCIKHNMPTSSCSAAAAFLVVVPMRTLKTDASSREIPERQQSVKDKRKDAKGNDDDTTKVNAKKEKQKQQEKEKAESSSSSSSDSESDDDKDEGNKRTSQEEDSKKKKLLHESAAREKEEEAESMNDEILSYLREPKKVRFGPLKVILTIIIGIYAGAFLAKFGANLLEEYEIFVKDNDDDD